MTTAANVHTMANKRTPFIGHIMLCGSDCTGEPRPECLELLPDVEEMERWIVTYWRAQ